MFGASNLVISPSTAGLDASEAAVDGMAVTLTPGAIRNLFWALDLNPKKKPHRHGHK